MGGTTAAGWLLVTGGGLGGAGWLITGAGAGVAQAPSNRLRPSRLTVCFMAAWMDAKPPF